MKTGYIRVGRAILNIETDVITSFFSNNAAKKYSCALQGDSLGRGLVILADNFPKGTYTQVTHHG